MTRIVVLGDIGQPSYHVGDEAMTHAAVAELQSRGVEDITVLSRDPSQSEAKMGVRAMRTIEFPWPPVQRSRFLGEIRDVLNGATERLDADHPVHAVIREIRSCDGILIAGGGNLNSLYGWLLYERAAVALIAKSFGKKVIISGQTFGPSLLPEDKQVLSEMLAGAVLVGAREADSHRFALELGVQPERLVRTFDDASFLAASSKLADGNVELPPEYIVATVAPESHRDQTRVLPHLARALANLSKDSEMPVVLIPHMGFFTRDGKSEGVDVDSHNALLVHAPGANFMPLEVVDALTAVEITRGASLVVSNRYHPLVFAAAQMIPTVGVCMDDYSQVRLTGTLANWGISDYGIAGVLAGTPVLTKALAEAWSRRTEIASHLGRRRPYAEALMSRWWDEVVRSFTVARTEKGTAGLQWEAAEELEGSTEWTLENRELLEPFGRLSRLLADRWCEWDLVRSEKEDLESARDERVSVANQEPPTRHLLSSLQRLMKR